MFYLPINLGFPSNVFLHTVCEVIILGVQRRPQAKHRGIQVLVTVIVTSERTSCVHKKHCGILCNSMMKVKSMFGRNSTVENEKRHVLLLVKKF